MAKLYNVCFSPTGGSAKLSAQVVRGMQEQLGMELCEVDLTKPAGREDFGLKLAADDVLVLAFPVYTGRMPLTLRETIDAIEADGAKAVVVASYGNRHYDDALREGFDFVADRGFAPVAACAFSAEHSFTKKLATGRPDDADLEKAFEYGKAIGEKLAGEAAATPEIPGNFPYVDYNGVMPFRPKTTDACSQCGDCAVVCPTGNIDPDNNFEAGDNCIQCFACVKACPAQGKYFDDAPLMGIIGFLEANCTERKEPELFL